VLGCEKESEYCSPCARAWKRGKQREPAGKGRREGSPGTREKREQLAGLAKEERGKCEMGFGPINEDGDEKGFNIFHGILIAFNFEMKFQFDRC
jgi:hypothetical protein